MSNEKYIIANWKIYLSYAESLKLAQDLVSQDFAVSKNTEVVLCPPQVALAGVADIIRGSSLKLGAQDCFWENQGHFTGEVPPIDIKELAGEYVIVGHSERREHLGETDKQVNKKIKAALAAGLTPILCVGESLSERDAGQTQDKVRAQLKSDLNGVKLSRTQGLIVAYEPIWAIYPSPLEVDPPEIEKIGRAIGFELKDLLSSNSWSVIYGGSVQAQDINNYLSLESISGALIGHASTQREEFVKILKQASKT